VSQLGFDMTPDTEVSNRFAPALIALAVIVAMLIGLAAAFVTTRGAKQEAWTGPGTGTVRVVIPSGSSGSAIGKILQSSGVVTSADDVVDALKANPRGNKVLPGTYDLRAQMGATEAVTLLLDPASRKIDKLVLPEGLRQTATVAAITKATKIPKAQVEKALEAAPELGLPDYAGGNPEGFLFPATYEFAPDAKAEAVITRLLKRFKESATKLELETRADDLGYTPYEVMIVASLVQGEGDVASYPKVARVIYNRLREGMPLQLDATVNYGLGTSDIQLSQDQLDSDSPYNTYTNKGLPPGPINSPGDKAIDAALAPEEGDWLYFVTVDPTTGETKFTSSYREFLKFKREFQQNVNQGSSGNTP